MTQYKPILQDQAATGIRDLDHLIDQGGMLTIQLWDYANNSADRKLIFEFHDYLAYRKLDEGDALMLLHELAATSSLGRHFYYEVADGDFHSWFRAQNDPKWRERALQHHLICAIDDVIEVISLSGPQLRTQPG